MRHLVVLDAPSDLGRRPPAPGTVPGCHKLAGALREQGIVRRLRALEGGVEVPPRHDLGDRREDDGVPNAPALAVYTRRLADRIEHHVRAGDLPVVLGGDCSIQLGAALALRRTGRYGLAALGATAGFRPPGDRERTGAAADAYLALSTGRGRRELTALEGLRPYLRDDDVRLLGLRDAHCDRPEHTRPDGPGGSNGPGGTNGPGSCTATVGDIRERGVDDVVRAAATSLEADVLRGFWVHVDADVLDPSVMPAVRDPEADGLVPDEVAALLAPLVHSPRCAGLTIAGLDPDLDPDGAAGALLADLVAAAFAPL
ncbi:arginase family protein [Streptomyces sulfonofaciens]|nr:arginase family protein [Streptomyces sulfonofaciens]